MAATDWWDALAEGVVLIEGDRVTGVNAAAARLLRVEPAWAVGKDLFLVLRNNELERIWRGGGGAEVTLGERVVIAQRMPAGLLLEDVTEEWRSAATARELLAVISHELRTPMTTVRSTLEALEYGDLPAEQRTRLLERARAESDRVIRLLSDLTVSVDPPRERTIELQEVFLRAEALLATTLSERKTTLRASLEGAVVWADPDKLLQVLLNLVENAALHGPAGGEVDVTAVDEGDWLELRVSDSGGPLPKDVAGRLFSPYSGTGRGRGRGLGLYIVKTMVERWGGEVWASRWSDEHGGSGNRFHALVPRRRGSR